MRLIVCKNKKEVDSVSARIIYEDLLKNHNFKIGLATGESYKGIYKEILKLNKKKKVNKFEAFQLDEYYPTNRLDKRNLFNYLLKRFIQPMNVKFNSIIDNIKNEDECKNYSNKILKSKIDLQLLGIGINGHIGFNEPGSKSNSKCRKVRLTKETKNRNHTEFNFAITLGINEIIKSKKILLVAFGDDKSDAIKKMVLGKKNTNCPASLIKDHPNLVVVVDKAAGKFL